MNQEITLNDLLLVKSTIIKNIPRYTTPVSVLKMSGNSRAMSPDPI